jgi:hypothetical protein
MRFLPALLLLGGCTTPRTEVVLGIATDMPVTMMNQVDLKIFREGVLEFVLPMPWSVQGPNGGDYELPASFGVFSDDGSETKITVELTGYLNDTVVVVRRAAFSLRKEQTLYMRMALLQSCKSVWMGCDPSPGDLSQTCIEGACKSAEVDVQTFNAYTAGVEKVISCGSAHLIDTKTAQALAMGPEMPGSCRTCVEGACYK